MIFNMTNHEDCIWRSAIVMKFHRVSLFTHNLAGHLKIQSFQDSLTIQKVTEIEYYVAFCTLKVKYFNTTNVNIPIQYPNAFIQFKITVLTFRKHRKQLTSQNVRLKHPAPFKMQLIVKISIQIEQFYALAYKFIIPLQCNRKGN